MALLSVVGIAVSVREQMLPWPKDANFIQGAESGASFLSLLFAQESWGSVYQRATNSIVCHPCGCTIPLFPNHLDPGLGCITSLQIRRMNVVIFPLSRTAG